MNGKLQPASVATTETAARPFEVVPERLLHDWRATHRRALAYLEALGIPAGERELFAHDAIEAALARAVWPADGDAVTETLRALRAMLPERLPASGASASAADTFLTWRLEAYLAERMRAGPPAPPLPDRPTSMPPLVRRAMIPEKIERRVLRRFINRFRPGWTKAARARRRTLRARRALLPWIHAARRRRLLLAALVLIPSVIASGFMVNVLPHQGGTWLEFFIVIFFGALFGWISIGFWTALLGFVTLAGRRSRFAITRPDPGDDTEFRPEGRTAVVMPICEEPVARVFAGLQAIYQSLERTGALAHFDFFILSDSSSPSTWVREEEAWASWCRAVNGFGRIFYRRRRVRLARKSGNVADFCRRWGNRYRYMIMLDADSIMAGATLVRLVRMMERRPDAGMIQTAPTAVNRRSLFARVQQFASHVYLPMFAAGLHYWQLGDGQYWGHNAIIRLEPFMDHCALPRLP